ncbi:MAG: SIMPL domain-containing protein [Paludibacter sp.]|nr:SIMPL domain-containing protein [Paludibacter sp.]
MKNNIQYLILGVCIFVGLLAVAIGINKGLQSFSNKERVVTVRGLAEKQIKATSASIQISYSFSGDEPKPLIDQIDRRTNEIISYLKKKGYNDNKIDNLQLYDSKTYYEYDWVDGKRIQVKKDRFRASKSISFVLSEVEKVEGISNEINIDLINSGLTSDVTTSYNFPELNDIKPALIAESTKNARTAGEQFAKDSQSRLGKIKTASQGQITLANRYYDDEDTASTPSEPFIEKARVVSSIVFFLED